MGDTLERVPSGIRPQQMLCHDVGDKKSLKALLGTLHLPAEDNLHEIVAQEQLHLADASICRVMPLCDIRHTKTKSLWALELPSAQ